MRCGSRRVDLASPAAVLVLVLSGAGHALAQGAQEFIYVGNALDDTVSGYVKDATTGGLSLIPGSPFAVGDQPVAVAVDPFNRYLYVANAFSSNISAFRIGPSAVLTPVPGSPFFENGDPESLAVDATGNFLYVADPALERIKVFRIDQATGALTGLFGNGFLAANNVYAVTISQSGRFLYASTLSASSIFGFSINTGTGALTPMPGSPWFVGNGKGTFSLVVDSSERFLYAGNTDADEVVGYSINAATGALTALPGGPVATGDYPQWLGLAPTGKYLYTSNTFSHNLSGYSVNLVTGVLTPLPGFPVATEGNPEALVMDPSGRLLYVPSFDARSVRGWSIHPTTGWLAPLAGSAGVTGAGPRPMAGTRFGAKADLSITKTDGQTTVVAGSTTTYTIIVTNGGPVDTAAMVGDTFPAPITSVSWTCSASAGSSCGAPSGLSSINAAVSLLAGGTATFTAVATISPSATGTLSNSATVTAAGSTDPDPGDNVAIDTDSVQPATDLAITKNDGQSTATPVQVVTYTIVASNAGPNSATGALVADPVPASLSTVTWTCVGAGGAACTPAGGGSINDTVDLPVGGSVTYTLTGTVSANPSHLRNTATVSVPGGLADFQPANNTATDDDTLLCFGETVLVPDGRVTSGTLAPGTSWFASSLSIGNSYSVEFKSVSGNGTPPGVLTMFSGDDGCTLTSTLTPRDTLEIDPASGASRRVSFTAAGVEAFFRAKLDNAAGPMTIAFAWSDTTMFSPAWSTNGAFDTFYSFQNTTGMTLNGRLRLLDTAGAVAKTVDLVIPPGRTGSANTMSFGVVRNRTGTARFTHDGPPGAVLAEAAIANFSISPAYVQPVKFQPTREAR